MSVACKSFVAAGLTFVELVLGMLVTTMVAAGRHPSRWRLRRVAGQRGADQQPGEDAPWDSSRSCSANQLISVWRGRSPAAAVPRMSPEGRRQHGWGRSSSQELQLSSTTRPSKNFPYQVVFPSTLTSSENGGERGLADDCIFDATSVTVSKSLT
jgi:hypothetical protein